MYRMKKARLLHSRQRFTNKIDHTQVPIYPIAFDRATGLEISIKRPSFACGAESAFLDFEFGMKIGYFFAIN